MKHASYNCIELYHFGYKSGFSLVDYTRSSDRVHTYLVITCPHLYNFFFKLGIDAEHDFPSVHHSYVISFNKPTLP